MTQLEQNNNYNFPDLSDLLEQIDFDAKPISHGSVAKHGHFSVSKWGSLIIELIAYPERQGAILDVYGITPFQFSELMGNPMFVAMYKDTESSLSALASNGGFQINARRLAEQGLTVLEEIIDNGEDKDRLKAIELAARLANLDPLVQAKTKEQNMAVNTGVQVVVNFSPDMPLPESFNSSKQVVIETVAENIDDR